MRFPAGCYLSDFGVTCALGLGKDPVARNLFSGSREGLKSRETTQGRFTVAEAPVDTGSYGGKWRIETLLYSACHEINPSVEAAVRRYGPDRIGVILGSTDYGSEPSFDANRTLRSEGRFPPAYSLDQQAPHALPFLVRTFFGTTGPAVAVSTACTSSASALASARRLLAAGVCDAVVVGGADLVSDSVLFGFNALQAVDPAPSNPFSRNRQGINLGEAAALFLVTRDALVPGVPQLLGTGESSDAHHMTAPDPQGNGAVWAMETALADAGLVPGDIGYTNLHGTGTVLNDEMESRAMARVFPAGVPCSSTKGLVGHTLGAAGALELGFCWLALSDRNPGGLLPPHVWDGQPDPGIPALGLCPPGTLAPGLKFCMSNSYAFGGSNVSLIIGKDQE